MTHAPDNKPVNSYENLNPPRRASCTPNPPMILKVVSFLSEATAAV